ncbi:MAG: leucyl/phenylalanyl-tRNA--protein transferase [Alphaproteobacteria bacterium]|nr:leucyl/phenylalanyl-tRNA--protein transferase [Alphaproteobacteria bacterium]
MPDLTPELLLCAYASGIFPMADDRDDPAIQWIDPHQRGVIPLDRYHVPRSLKKVIRQQRFEIRADTAFESVINACAECRPDRPRTWLNDQLIELYCVLHQRQYAHSVECWLDDRLVGGVYGLSLGGAFFGESMFSRARDASKVALVDLIERLNRGGYRLLDTQFVTDHLKRFGAIQIPRDIYLRRLREALEVQARFHSDAGVIVSSTPWPLKSGSVGSSQSTTQMS